MQYIEPSGGSTAHRTVLSGPYKGSLISQIWQLSPSNTKSISGEKMQWIRIQRPVHSCKHSAFTPSENSLANNNCWIVSCIAQKVFFALPFVAQLKATKKATAKKKSALQNAEWVFAFVCSVTKISQKLQNTIVFAHGFH